MYNYNIFQWLLFFFVYCFFGWCIESTIVSVNKKHFVNRGFLRLPMLPLYGTGAVLILWITLPYQDFPWMVYINGLIGATILEYVTGWAMESLFKMKYWDYSSQKLQLHGRICVSSSLFWGVLSVALTEFIHPPIEHWVLNLNPAFVMACTLIISCIMLADTIVSTRAALDLAKVLKRLSAARDEIEELGRQLEEIKESAQLQLAEIKDTAQEQLRERRDAIKKRLSEITEEREREFLHIGFLKSQLIKGHPTSYSKKFNAALKEIKERINSNYR